MSKLSVTTSANTKSSVEPWLRGTQTDAAPEQRAILHALELAREDIAAWCGPLDTEEMHVRPYGLASVAFHLRHMARSLDRLLTYAEGNPLSEEQKRQLSTEMASGDDHAAIFDEFHAGLDTAEKRIRVIAVSQWFVPRGVGRKQLPTTVAGLLIHCADHTQRHVGQAITTAKVVLALRDAENS